MSSEVTIRVQGLGKKFCPDFRRSLAYAVSDIAAEMTPAMGSRVRLRRGEFWALRDVSFTVRRGEALALIGHNGAGKSTLLKILYGLLRQDVGTIGIAGRVVALIELGAGINPLLSASENIVLVALLHGLPRSEARALVPAVLDFAELTQTADTAVQTFSSGMRARLSYAIAAMLRPDVLLVDEVLAVGDLAFQRKCIVHMQRFIADGGTLVLVSHVPHHVQAICSHAILLNNGLVVAAGDPAGVVRRYLELRPVTAAVVGSTRGGEPLRVDGVTLTANGGGPARTGEPARLAVTYEAETALVVFVGMSIWTQDGWTCITSSVDMAARNIDRGRGVLECQIARLPLIAGHYIARPIVVDAVAHRSVPLGGAAHSGETVQVAGDPDLLSNGQMQLGQLIEVEAEWLRQVETVVMRDRDCG